MKREQTNYNQKSKQALCKLIYYYFYKETINYLEGKGIGRDVLLCFIL